MLHIKDDNMVEIAVVDLSKVSFSSVVYLSS